ncbi:cytochrome P450 [Colletotrichum zoysiae]|uniref:Cytochrome P450 n=1 Tax=Colletotrichum zoysiae TaxID=1216348 RepID=A0AAD9HA96_9PEZI|nr:cytochrome P450 [Colletotrichum zoysiae]
MKYSVFAFLVCAATAVLLRLVNFLKTTITIRKSWTHLPGAPRSFFRGNLHNTARLIPSDRHIDYGLYAIWENLARPKWFIVDLWPIQKPLICIADASIAEQMSRATESEPESTPKMRIPESLETLIGSTSISSAQGAKWRHVRQRLNPLFRPKVVYSSLTRIVELTDVFVGKLCAAARADGDVTLGDLLADLATDVIGSCVVGYDIDAQSSEEGEKEKGPDGLLTCLRESVALQPLALGPGFFQRLSAKRKLKHYKRVLDTRIAFIIQQDPESGFAARYIGPAPWDQRLFQECIDQFKTLILAGQDTTSCALQWSFFYLWKKPEVLRELRSEHDSVLGPDPLKSSARLREEPQLLQKLPYTTAVIKETLRLRGISGTTREPTRDMMIDVNGEQVLLEAGAICYVNNFLLMKNPEHWGPDAESFRPSRFFENPEDVAEASDGGAKQGVPAMRNISYRPFERGPRNCIGQELTMLEMRVVLALTVRRFDFFKKGFDGVLEEEVYDISRVVHSPVDRMRMRVTARAV